MQDHQENPRHNDDCMCDECIAWQAYLEEHEMKCPKCHAMGGCSTCGGLGYVISIKTLNKDRFNFIQSSLDQTPDNIEGKNLGGRPPKYESPEDLELAIEGYIKDCPDKRTCYTSEGVEYFIKVPTISGLAYFLGFESRQSMYDYENKDERFSYTIKRARLWMETHYERLAQGKTPTGAIFALKNMGWKDETSHKVKGEMTQKNVEISKEDYAKIRAEMIKDDDC